MLSKYTQFFIIYFVMITNTIQTTKTAQHTQSPLSILTQYNLETITTMQQTVIAILNDYEKNYENYKNNMHKAQDIFWALKKFDSCIRKKIPITTTDITSLEQNLADIQKTNNRYTDQRLLKRQKYIAQRLADLRKQITIFDSEEVP